MKEFSQHFFASLQHSWNSFAQQFPNILLAIFIVTAGIFLSGKISLVFRRVVATRTHDEIVTNFLVKAMKVIVASMFIMYALNVAGLDKIAGGILAAAGASTLVLGFAFKDIGENFISGIILSFNRPFNVNETVLIGDVFGKVRTIQFRYTKLRTFDGRDVYIPNSDVIKKPVFNYTEDGLYRFDFMVGIAYENDIVAAEKLIMETLEECSSVLKNPSSPNFVIADSLATNTVNLKVHFWVETHEFGREALLKKGEVVSRIKEKLLKSGFNLPANIQELKLYETQKNIPVIVG